MTRRAESQSEPESRLERVLAEYLRADDEGRPLDRAALLAKYPDLAGELQSFFRNRDAMTRIAEPFQGSPAEMPTLVVAEAPATVGPRVRYFGDYEILGEIARGGMGVVYRARQVSLNRPVALKMILAGQFATKADHDRFHSEAEAAANLDHPNIVPVFEVGEHEGQHYFSMKLVEGGSLAAHMPELLKSPRDAARVLLDIARAVHYAHQRGILHRDLKPANILLESNGRPMVTDFGLAKQVESQDGQTSTGAILGTPAYMAPEQARGEKDLTTAVDVYSLGAILYALLTGHPPFHGATPMETLLMVVSSEPKRPSSVLPHVDCDLETIALKCLAKEPSKRYRSAEELADDLGRYLAGEPIVARPVGSLERAVKWARRRPAIAGLLAALVLVAVVGFAGVYWKYREAEQQKLIAQTQRDLAEEQQAIAEEQSKLAERHRHEAMQSENEARQQLDHARRTAFTAQVLRASAIWDREPQQARRILEDPSVCPLEFRDFAWRYYSGLSHWEYTVLDGHRTPIACARISPDGKTIVSSGADATIQWWDLPSGRPRALVQGKIVITDLAFCPDGKTLLASYIDRSVKLLDATTGREKKTLATFDGEVAGIACSPDGRWAAAGFRHPDPQRAGYFVNGEVALWNLTTGQRRALRPITHGGIIQMDFSPDSKTLATGNSDARIHLWDVASGQHHLLPHDTGWAESVAFSPDGKLIAHGSADEIVRLWNAASGELVASLLGHTGQVEGVAFSPDGRTLAAADNATIRLWNVATHQEQTTLHQVPRTIPGYCGGALAFTPDGKMLMTVNDGGMTLKLWKPPQEAGRATPKPGQYGIRTMAVTPDGIRLAYGDGNAIQIWDLPSGRPVATLAGHSAEVASLAYSRDGRRLASASLDHSVRVWDAATLSEQAALWSDHGPAHSVAWTCDGTRIAAGYADGTIALWDPAARKIRATLASHKSPVRHVAFSADGKLLVAAHENQTPNRWDWDSAALDCWDVAAGAVLWSLANNCPEHLAAFSPDGRILAMTGDGPVRLWDVAGRRRWSVILEGQEAVVDSIAFSPDGKTIALGTENRDVQLWDLASGQLRATFTGHTKPVTALAFTRNGSELVSGSGVISLEGWYWVHGGEIKIWATDDGCRRATLAGSLGAVDRLAFSPDGRTLAAASSPPGLDRSNTIARKPQAVQCWDVLTGQPYAGSMKPEGNTHALAFSPDGRTLALGGDRAPATLWDVATGQLQASLDGNQGVINALEFTPDGKTLISAGDDHHVRLWDPAARICRAVLAEHQAKVACLAVSSDGQTLASGDEGHVIVLWDLAQGKKRTVLSGGAAGISALAFSPDGKTLASGSVEGSARLWDLVVGKPRATLSGHEGSVLRMAFSPDGRELTSIDAKGTKFWWDATTGRRTGSRPPDGTSAVAKTTAINPRGNLWAGGYDDGHVDLIPLVSPHNLALEHWNRAWAQVNAGQPAEARADLVQATELEPDSTDIWHDLEVVDQKGGDWAHALDDCTAAIARDPESEPCRRDRGHVYQRLGRWKEAAADYVWVAEHRPDDADGRPLECAAALLLSDDHAAYRALCARAVQKYSSAKDPHTKYYVARLCALEAGAVTNPAQPLEWAQQAAKSNRSAWHLHILGLAQLRAGQPEQAVKSFHDSIASAADWAHVVNWLGLALAYHQVGKADDAQKWWRKSQEWIAKAVKDWPRDQLTPNIHPNEWLECQLLSREAKECLEESPHGFTVSKRLGCAEKPVDYSQGAAIYFHVNPAYNR